MTDRQLGRLLMNSIDAMGGSASMEVILRSLSTVTGTKALELVDQVDNLIGQYIERGLIRRLNGLYHIVEGAPKEIFDFYA
ncbi:uncharacterized protein LOC108024483 [Drosophila biarmipes]|uniref:uncharacterized protein LOC108024483 n=1 Tax=Drosophila biarmipes TaxID=125945 RepID=UPI0007E64977|nr:uncharacterized protein LOC108024483 [Drosophila biarmipes]